MDRDDPNYQEYLEEQESQDRHQLQKLQDQYLRNQRRKRRGALDWIKTARRVIQIARLVANPTTIYVSIGIIVAIVIFSIFFSNTGYTPTSFTPNGTAIITPIPGRAGITITATGPRTINFGENITYTVRVNYDGSADPPPPPKDQLVVYYLLPPDTAYVSSSTSACQNYPQTFVPGTPGGGPDRIIPPRVECDWANLAVNEEFTTTIRPTRNDISVIVSFRVILQGDAILGAQTSIVNANCKKAYDSTTKDNKDHDECLFSKDSLYQLLEREDPENADIWFYKIIPCESGFDPGIISTNPSGSKTGGLLQLPLAENVTDTTTDWREQIINAIKYNKTALHNDFSYWRCSGL